LPAAPPIAPIHARMRAPKPGLPNVPRSASKSVTTDRESAVWVRPSFTIVPTHPCGRRTSEPVAQWESAEFVS